MPNSLIKKIHEETKEPIEKLEAIWEKAILEAQAKNIENKYAYAVGALEAVKKNIVTDSNRIEQPFNYLTVENCVLTGADVAKYFGFEVPNFKELGLEPTKIYNVYRPQSEIHDSNFNLKPLLSRHIDFSADDYKHKFIVGAVGDTRMEGEELKATIEFWSQEAIDNLNKGIKKLSCGYTYTPVLETGIYNGQSYDIKMTNIEANHVAMVDNPRYKSAIVADEKFSINKLLKGIKKMSFLSKLKKLVMDEESMSFDEGIEAAKSIMANDSLSEKEKEEALEELKEKGKKADAKDEELKAKMQKATELAGDEDKPEEKKEEKKVAMDSDFVNKIEAIIQKRVAEELNKHSQKRSVFDSALEQYERTCGKANKTVFDSAEDVYNTILKNNKVNYEGKTIEQKQAMVEMIPNFKKQSYQQVVHDGYGSTESKIPSELANFLNSKGL